MTLLIVVAHPDDEVLGAGAYASFLASRGSEVQAVILSGQVTARQGRPAISTLQDQTRRAHEILGMRLPVFGSFQNIAFNTERHLALVQFIETAIANSGATDLLTHHPGDLNNDHHHTATACAAAARLWMRRPGVQPLKSLLFMEVLSSTDWSFPGTRTPFDPDSFVEVGSDHLERKLQALACFEGVMRPYPHSRSVESVRALATIRGSQAGVQFAEAFQTGFRLLSGPE